MTGTPTVIFVHGGTGRMGRAVTALVPATEGVSLGGVLEIRRGKRPAGLGEDLPVFRTVPRTAEGRGVVIDFSRPEALGPLMKALAGSGLPLVCGTTGLSGTERDLLNTYSKESPVFYDDNMSYGISLLKKLLRIAAERLGDAADVEIVEFHHRDKRDFPSGTALALAGTAAPAASPVAGRAGAGGPARDRVHIHSVRVGGVPGEHRVYFATDDEVLTLAHRAVSREVFARGAIRAARFLTTRDRGLYSMEDLVGAHHI